MEDQILELISKLNGLETIDEDSLAEALASSGLELIETSDEDGNSEGDE